MIPGSANSLLLASAAGAAQYQIERSLRFNSADYAYLFRTPSSAGNRKTWTWAGWVKRGSLSGIQNLFANMNAGNSVGVLAYFDTNFQVADYNISQVWGLVSTATYRDLSAWYHFMVAIDTTQATGSDRVKFFVNGQQITVTGTYPALNSDTGWNTTAFATIANQGAVNANYFNGYLADIHFIDGQYLTPSSFGYTDSNGVWQPKTYTGTYGTNGFHLDFADNSAASTAGIGKDVSGNGNNWSPINLSVTAGAGNDSLVDTPTNYGTDTGVGGEVRGNYCTLNPLDGSPAGLGNGNLDAASANAYPTILPGSGQWYYEVNGTGYTWDGTRANWTPRAGSHNFGQRTWASSAPSGYKALCTQNLSSTTITTSGSYTGNGLADGPFVYLNGVPTAMTIGGNAVTFGTEADKLSNGFKVRTTSTTYNQNAATYNYSITSTGDPFKVARAQSNP